MTINMGTFIGTFAALLLIGIVSTLKYENSKSSISKTYDSLIYDEEYKKFVEKNRIHVREYAEMYASKIEFSEQAYKTNFIERFCELQFKIVKDNPKYYLFKSEEIFFQKEEVENSIDYKKFCEIAHLIKYAYINRDSQTINFVYEKTIPCDQCKIYRCKNCKTAKKVDYLFSVKFSKRETNLKK